MIVHFTLMERAQMIGFQLLKMVANGIGFFVGAVTAGWIAYNIDTRFPVIENFVIDAHIEHTQMVAKGTMNWVRDCPMQYLHIYATAPGVEGILLVNINREQLLNIAAADIKLGPMKFGPIKVPLMEDPQGYKTIQIIGDYKCHPFWVQTDILAVLDASTLRQIK